jgi:F-type H+-transporting ATPase subunit c
VKNVKIFLVALAVMLFGCIAFAAEGSGTVDPYASLAAGIGIGLAAFGGSLGQGNAAAKALEGIARNPSAAGKLLGPMIICLALIESLVIYAFLVCFIKIKFIN